VGGRALAADAGGHQDGAGENGGRLEKQLAPVALAGLLDAGKQGVEGDLARDVTAVAALVVEVVRVPFTKDVVGRRLTG